MNNYGESCIMTWPLGAVKRWDIFCENWEPRTTLKLNYAQTRSLRLKTREFTKPRWQRQWERR